MKTLYDLLGALPDDDADQLRAAFRRAAKANHPDNNPDNPEAAERFRRIVRANAILSDGQQRVAYDRLLETARRQQSPKPRRSTLSGTAQRLAADAAASAVVSFVLIGGYLLYKPVDRLPLASAQMTETSAPKPAQAPTAKAAELSDAHGQAEQHDRHEVTGADVKLDVTIHDAKEPAEPDGVAPAVTNIKVCDHRHRYCERECFTSSRLRDQRRPILSRTSHPGVSHRRSVYCAREFRSGDQPGPQSAGFLHRSRHCLPSPGRSQARIFRHRRSQAH